MLKKLLQKVGDFLRSLSGWVYLFTTIVPAGSTYIAAVIEGIPWSTRIPLVTAAAAAGFALAHYALRAYTFVSERYGFRKDINGVIAKLQALIDADQQYLKIGPIVDLWTDDDRDKLWLWNPRLRKLKEGVEEGHIGHVVDGYSPSKRTAVELKDVVGYLKGLESLKLNKPKL